MGMCHYSLLKEVNHYTVLSVDMKNQNMALNLAVTLSITLIGSVQDAANDTRLKKFRMMRGMRNEQNRNKLDRFDIKPSIRLQ